MRLRCVAVCFMLFSLGGCLLFSRVQYSGFPATSIGLWDDIKEGVSRDDVLAVLGHPVIVEEGVWIYPSCKLYRTAASIIKEYECDVLRVVFDDEDKVSEKERLHTPMRGLRSISRSRNAVSGIHDGAWRKIEDLLGAGKG